MRINTKNSFWDTYDYAKELEIYKNIGKRECSSYLEWKKAVLNKLPNNIPDLKEIKYYLIRKKRNKKCVQEITDKVANPIYFALIAFMATLVSEWIKKGNEIDFVCGVGLLTMCWVMVILFLSLMMKQNAREEYFCIDYLKIIEKKMRHIRKTKKKNK